MREVPGSRRHTLHFIFASACLFALGIYALPASAQSGSGSDQPQVQAPEKPFDPNTVEPTSLHTPAKEDVKHDTPGLTIKPGKMLHTDVDVALVNVTVTDPYNRLVTGLEPDNFRIFEDNTEQEVLTFSSEDVPISIGVIFDLSGSMSNKIAKSRRRIFHG
jgi:Ca-activated chloride channel homolog